MTAKTRSRKIDPARLEDLPSVLGTEQLCDVLRVGIRKLSWLVNSGKLGRLAYSPKVVLVDACEVRRFLKDQTTWIARTPFYDEADEDDAPEDEEDAPES